MKKTTTKKKVVKETNGPYLATLNLKAYKKIYRGAGNSVSEALLNITPLNQPKGVTILSITKGDVTREKILAGFQVARLFSPSRLVKEIALKNISSLFNL